jgi:hypothetical protein
MTLVSAGADRSLAWCRESERRDGQLHAARRPKKPLVGDRKVHQMVTLQS